MPDLYPVGAPCAPGGRAAAGGAGREVRWARLGQSVTHSAQGQATIARRK